MDKKNAAGSVITTGELCSFYLLKLKVHPVAVVGAKEMEMGARLFVTVRITPPAFLAGASTVSALSQVLATV